MGTVRDLTITSWLADASDEPLTLAVPGIKLTGWWRDKPPSPCVFNDLKGIWPDCSVSLRVESDILEDPDGKKRQVCAYVRIRQYPSEWLDVLGKSLEYFIKHGAAIAWAGGWECFLQYSSTETFSGCYAAYTPETGLVCASGLDEPVTYLDKIPNAAARLHAAVRRTGIIPGTARADCTETP